MPYHTLEIDDADYAYLEKASETTGLSIQLVLKQLIAQQQQMHKVQERNESPYSATKKTGTQSRWAEFSQRIHTKPPLQGAGEYVRESSKQFKEDFSLSHDED